MATLSLGSCRQFEITSFNRCKYNYSFVDLVLSDDSAAKFVMVSEKLSGPDSILVDGISNSLEDLIKTCGVGLLQREGGEGGEGGREGGEGGEGGREGGEGRGVVEVCL